jgi:hypothetical protein
MSARLQPVANEAHGLMIYSPKYYNRVCLGLR